MTTEGLAEDDIRHPVKTMTVFTVPKLTAGFWIARRQHKTPVGASPSRSYGRGRRKLADTTASTLTSTPKSC